jgi:hypothetical protein
MRVRLGREEHHALREELTRNYLAQLAKMVRLRDELADARDWDEIARLKRVIHRQEVISAELHRRHLFVVPVVQRTGIRFSTRKPKEAKTNA